MPQIFPVRRNNNLINGEARSGVIIALLIELLIYVSGIHIPTNDCNISYRLDTDVIMPRE